MADEHPIDVEAVEKEEEIQQVCELSAFNVSDDQLPGALKLKKEENSRQRVPIGPIIKIQRVPEIMRRSEDFSKCYKPMELSIGPIHASDPNLFKMELKVRLAAEFIKDSEQTEEDLLKRIKENIQDLKKLFNEEVFNSYSDKRLKDWLWFFHGYATLQPSDEWLARLLLLDGCATLQSSDEWLARLLLLDGCATLQSSDEWLARLFLLEGCETLQSIDEWLARLLLLDGCATLQFIFSFLDESLNKFGINNGQANLIQQDLFLLENQIPFQVLELLVKSSQVVSEQYLRERLIGFVLINNVLAIDDTALLLSYFRLSYISYHEREYNPAHLLDLLRFVLSSIDNDKKRRSVFENIYNRCCRHLVCDSIGHDPMAHDDPIAYDPITSPLESLLHVLEQRVDHSFRNVQELKAVGIKLKPSDSCSLRSVSFSTHFCFRGHLKLPPLVVDGSTTRKLLNLLAYEMCYPDDDKINEHENGIVASYIRLLDLLIDNEDDVKDLRAADIIRNHLSSDVEVAKLFNSLGSICIAPPHDIYKDVKRDIQKHYKRTFTIWMAQVYRDHFSSPWTILALLAAITVLVLTATQTYYAIHPKN